MHRSWRALSAISWKPFRDAARGVLSIRSTFPALTVGRCSLHIRDVRQFRSDGMYLVRTSHKIVDRTMSTGAGRNTMSDLKDWTPALGTAWQKHKSIYTFRLEVKSIFKQLHLHPREVVEKAADDMAQCQVYGISLSFLNAEKEPAGAAESIHAILLRLDAGDSADLLQADGLTAAEVDKAVYLHGMGLLGYLAHESSIEYLRSEQAEIDLEKLREAVDKLLEHDAQMRQEEEDKLTREGLPAPSYLDQIRGDPNHRNQFMPNAGKLVTAISAAAAESGFKIPQPFQADTLEEAIKGHIQSNSVPPKLAGAVRQSLRLLGDAMVHVIVKCAPASAIFDDRFLPIVDVEDGVSPRGQQLKDLLELCFQKDNVGLRGGTLMGYKGFGKSQLVRNMVLGKQLAGWALRDCSTHAGSMHHVGIYIPEVVQDEPTPLDIAPLWAYIAVSLDQLGLLRDSKGVVPNWAQSSKPSSARMEGIAQFMQDRKIDCVIAIDEAQLAREVVQEASPACNAEYTPRSLKFWRAVDRGVSIDFGVMVVLTGTGSELGSIVYERPKDSTQFKLALQRSKFKSRWMDFTYAEDEICLMLLRQRNAAAWKKDWLPDDGSDPAAVNGPVCGQDVVLALALAIQDAPASSPWASTGQMVFPSLEAVNEAMRSFWVRTDHAALSEGAVLDGESQSKVHAGRLTQQLAKELLSDPRAMGAAIRARDKLRHMVWQTGGLARSLADINGGGSMEVKMVDWFRHMDENTDGFRDVMLGMLSLMDSDNPTWLRDSLRNPLASLPQLPVPEVLTQMERLAGVEISQGEDREKKALELEKRLSLWRNKQLVGYRTKHEGPHNPQEGAISPAFTSFLGGAFAFLVKQHTASIKGVYLTQREHGSLQTQDGRFGKDFEMVVAESLHRGLVSKILAKGLLPKVPKEVWEGISDPIVEHDRGGCFQETESLFYIDKPFERSREELIGRVMREAPDEAGVDLSVILEARGTTHGTGTQSQSQVQYHVIRIQVKGGESSVDKTRVKSFLSKANVDQARAAYARALGVGEDEIQFHRMLMSLAPVARKVQKMVAAGQVGGKTQDETEKLEGVDVSDVWILKGDEFRRFLFPDAQITLNRMHPWDLQADEKRKLMQDADPVERRVSPKSPAQTHSWVSSMQKARAGKEQGSVQV